MCYIVIICSGWLSVDDDPLGYVSRIDQRIEDVTGLTMSTAEQLQVVNYGIGGHYEPHYDFARVGIWKHILKFCDSLLARWTKMLSVALELGTESQHS